jgi:hypothetical protein
VDLIVTRWRSWLAFAASGSALAFCWRHDWLLAVAAGSYAVLPSVLWLRGEMADTRAMMGMLARPGGWKP